MIPSMELENKGRRRIHLKMRRDRLKLGLNFFQHIR